MEWENHGQHFTIEGRRQWLRASPHNNGFKLVMPKLVNNPSFFSNMWSSLCWRFISWITLPPPSLNISCYLPGILHPTRYRTTKKKSIDGQAHGLGLHLRIKKLYAAYIP